MKKIKYLGTVDDHIPYKDTFSRVRVKVWDLSGNTYDVTLLFPNKNRIEYKTISGETFLKYVGSAADALKYEADHLRYHILNVYKLEEDYVFNPDNILMYKIEGDL